jgi:hypothetical protein
MKALFYKPERGELINLNYVVVISATKHGGKPATSVLWADGGTTVIPEDIKYIEEFLLKIQGAL